MGLPPDLVLGRVGHYFTPNATGGGFCQTAIIVEVLEALREVDGIPRVSIAGWEHDGDPFRHLEVPVYEQRTDGLGVGAASFHLTRDCPWGR